jgi:hypothetical protein
MSDEMKKTVSMAGSKLPRPVYNGIVLLLVAALLNLTLGCTNNTRFTKRAGEDIVITDHVQDPTKIILLHSHNGDPILHLSVVTVKDSLIKVMPAGTVEVRGEHYYYPSSDGMVKWMKTDDPRVVKVTVNKYTKVSNAEVTFMLGDIAKIDYTVSEVDIAASILAGAAMVAGVFFLIAVIELATKGLSCPFVYVYEQGQYKFIGEIYSGATYPSLERHDYLALGDLGSTDGQYRIKIANKVKEIQNTNLAELVVIDHPQGSRAVMDKNGDCQTFSSLQNPVKAVNLKGKDVSLELSKQDTLSYSGDGTPDQQAETDGVVLTFDRPAGADSAKLLLKAKNNLWLDYTFKRFHEFFGSYYHKWEAQQSKVPGDSISNWMAAQGVFLQVSLKKNGAWERVDQFNLPGPMAYREDALALDISGADSGPLEIKLEAGTLFWELDYAGIDFSSNTEVKTTVVPLSQATTEKGIDVAPLLNSDDGKYYSQPQIGEEAVLTFAAPASAGISRSVFLHSKGHYKILQDPKGRPDRKYLEAFLQPGRLNRFSLELLTSGLQGIKN